MERPTLPGNKAEKLITFIYYEAFVYNDPEDYQIEIQQPTPEPKWTSGRIFCYLAFAKVRLRNDRGGHINVPGSRGCYYWELFSRHA